MASETVKKSLTIAADFLKNIEINSTKMLEALEHSFTNATDAAEYLVKKGLPFRDAYTIVGKAVAYSIKESKFLHNLSLEEWQSFSEVFSEDIIQTIKIANCVDARNVYGATARSQVKQQIARLKEVLETYE